MTQVEILQTEMFRLEREIAELPGKADEAQAREDAKRAENWRKYQDNYPGPASCPSAGMRALVQTCKESLRAVWLRYIEAVGAGAWVGETNESSEICCCDLLHMTAAERLACAREECEQAFEMTGHATSPRIRVSSAQEALQRAARRLTMWVRCGSERAQRIFGLEGPAPQDGAVVYLEIETARPWIVCGYRWLLPLDAMSAEPEVEREEPPKPAPGPTHEQIMAEPTVTGEVSESPFPPSVRRTKAATRKRR